MENKENKNGSKALKIILITAGVIFFLIALGIGSCVYRIFTDPQAMEAFNSAKATDEEISDYILFLDMNINERAGQKARYENIIAENRGDMQFEDNEQAIEYYSRMRSSLSDIEGEDKTLAEAYLACGNYYAALAAKEEFMRISRIPKISKMMVKTVMNEDKKYMEFKKRSGENSGRVPAE